MWKTFMPVFFKYFYTHLFTSPNTIFFSSFMTLEDHYFIWILIPNYSFVSN